MRNNGFRIILDTNLWISFLITNDFSRLDQMLFAKQCVIVFSEELLDEFIEVANRAKFRRYFSKTDIENILETVDEFGNLLKSTVK